MPCKPALLSACLTAAWNPIRKGYHTKEIHHRHTSPHPLPCVIFPHQISIIHKKGTHIHHCSLRRCVLVDDETVGGFGTAPQWAFRGNTFTGKPAHTYTLTHTHTFTAYGEAFDTQCTMGLPDLMVWTHTIKLTHNTLSHSHTHTAHTHCTGTHAHTHSRTPQGGLRFHAHNTLRLRYHTCMCGQCYADY